MFDYNNKVAIITGGGSGIGRATGALMAASGASVVIADFDSEAGEVRQGPQGLRQLLLLHQRLF